VRVRHGVTIGDPPLPRSIGVALETGDVHLFFDRGAPLPTRRTYTLSTATPLGPTITGSKLSIPIVQGEFPLADLCRLVGRIEIEGARLPRPVAPGTKVEIVLSLDRGGELRGSATIAGVDQVFDHVAQLVTPAMSHAELRAQATRVRDRLAALFGVVDPETRAKVQTLDGHVDEVESDADLAEGGDADALEKGRRRLLEVDGEIHAIEAARAWPELEAECENTSQFAILSVGQHGSDVEKASMSQSLRTLTQALHARDVVSVRRQLKYLDGLSDICYSRDPEAWVRALEFHASRIHEAYDLPAANRALNEGREAVRRKDHSAVRSAVQALRALLPAHDEQRKRSLGSGVRS
jgi:molecular chaperone DnaK